MQTPRNARFWQYINGDFVKITLHPGDALNYLSYERTDEGYHHERTLWEFDGSQICRHSLSDSRDCDGRFSRQYTQFCTLASLAEIQAYGDDSIYLPKWEDLDYRQRDYVAETAGY